MYEPSHGWTAPRSGFEQHETKKILLQPAPCTCRDQKVWFKGSADFIESINRLETFLSLGFSIIYSPLFECLWWFSISLHSSTSSIHLRLWAKIDAKTQQKLQTTLPTSSKYGFTRGIMCSEFYTSQWIPSSKNLASNVS